MLRCGARVLGRCRARFPWGLGGLARLRWMSLGSIIICKPSFFTATYTCCEWFVALPACLCRKMAYSASGCANYFLDVFVFEVWTLMGRLLAMHLIKQGPMQSLVYRWNRCSALQSMLLTVLLVLSAGGCSRGAQTSRACWPEKEPQLARAEHGTFRWTGLA